MSTEPTEAGSVNGWNAAYVEEMYERWQADESSVDRAVTGVEDKLGPPTILVAHAGVTRDGLVLRMKDDDFTEVVDANLAGSFRVAKRVIKPMMKAMYDIVISPKKMTQAMK